MDDEKVAKYIKVFFDHSPRAASGSAPAAEWLEFLKLFNKSDEDYMLSESERKAVLPYCQQNPELEMTPEEFTSLLHLVRHAEEKFDTPITPLHAARTSTKPDTPHVRASYNRARNVMDSRPRSSKILNTNRSYSYYDDRTSINHPDSNVRIDIIIVMIFFLINWKFSQHTIWRRSPDQVRTIKNKQITLTC